MSCCNCSVNKHQDREMKDCGCYSHSNRINRNFYSIAERKEGLIKYKETLEKELIGVKEKIKEMS